MPRTCTICTHPERAAIDKALVDGEPYRTIAQRFAASPDAVLRHKGSHLPAALTKAQAAQEVAQADDLLSRLELLQRHTLAILGRAEKLEDLRTALQAISQARQNLELLARLLGELRDQEVKVAVLVASPDWLRVRAAILAALDPYPDARLAVVGALARVG